MNNDIPNIASFRGNASFPPWHQDYIPTAQEWLNCFSNKADDSDVELLKKNLFPNGNAGENKNLIDRILTLEKDNASLLSSLTRLKKLITLPTTLCGVTLDDYDGQAFFDRERSRLLASLEQQQRTARLAQKVARERQRAALALQSAGVTL